MEKDGRVDTLIILFECLSYSSAILIFEFRHRLIQLTFDDIEIYLKVKHVICYVSNIFSKEGNLSIKSSRIFGNIAWGILRNLKLCVRVLWELENLASELDPLAFYEPCHLVASGSRLFQLDFNPSLVVFANRRNYFGGCVINFDSECILFD